MTNLSASLPRRRVSVWRLGTVWLFIAWERLWNALWPASGVVGLFLFLGLFELFSGRLLLEGELEVHLRLIRVDGVGVGRNLLKLGR